MYRVLFGENDTHELGRYALPTQTVTRKPLSLVDLLEWLLVKNELCKQCSGVHIRVLVCVLGGQGIYGSTPNCNQNE